jgi:hypothetical protein
VSDRLPPLDPEMRSAIARRLLFCRAYRQLKRAAAPRHNQDPDTLRRYAAHHRLVQWQFVDVRHARTAQRIIEEKTGFCIWLGPWWSRAPADDIPDLPSFDEALGITEE